MAFLDGNGVSALVQKLKSVFVLPSELDSAYTALATRIPEPAVASPLMDGTASVGTSTYYARQNHVHPTDTSRQAALVSGTNIKTINSTSLLGSGDISIAGLPSVTTADNGKVLQVVSGAWAAASLPSASGVSF